MADKKATENKTLQRDKTNYRTRFRHDRCWNFQRITMINMFKILIRKEDNIQDE